MRVVMFGFQTWGHRTLQALLASEHEVVLVVTHPKGEGAYEKVWSDSVEDLARENGVEVVVRERPEDQELLDLLKAADPDVIVACNWRTWIPPQVFALPKRGTLNVHDSLLPKYAGFSPLIWALLNDEKEVGVTAHMMDDTLDAGDIVLQRPVPVGPRDTTAVLFEKTLELFGPITVDGLAEIASGRTDFTKQDRSQAASSTSAPRKTCRIDFTWTAEELDRLVRAQCAPYPSAFCFHRGQRLEIIEADVSSEVYGGTPGRIFYREGDGVAVVAGAEARRGRARRCWSRRFAPPTAPSSRLRSTSSTMGGYLTSRP